MNIELSPYWTCSCGALNEGDILHGLCSTCGESWVDEFFLYRGDLVKAIKLLDSEAANVQPGTLGVVFEETNFYGDNCGPIVRWMTGTVCNVYEGDIEIVKGLYSRTLPTRLISRDIEGKENKCPPNCDHKHNAANCIYSCYGN